MKHNRHHHNVANIVHLRRLGLLLGALVVLASAGLLYGQQADRAVITGLVTDPSGAPIPAATVTIISQDTGVKTTVGTSSDGNYGTPPLILGTYTVRVEKAGFKIFERTGILLTGGAVSRQDAALEMGAVTQTVEVKGTATAINLSNAEISHQVNSMYYENLPLVMAGDIRLAEAALQLEPGYVPEKPAGNTQFRGGAFFSRVNGGQAMTMESFIDGAAYGMADGHAGTQEKSAPFESIREMNLVGGNFSAQYGHTSGGFAEYTTKSGTSQVHGSLYEFVGNDILNAEGELTSFKMPSKQNNYGGSIGGPVYIPHVYDGRGKTFFFTNWDWMDLRQGIAPTYSISVPTADMKKGDFSALLNTNDVVGTDALGRPIYYGEIFNPSTTRMVGEVPVRDGYGFNTTTGLPITGSANMIPSDDPLLSTPAANMTALIQAPTRAGTDYNAQGYSDTKKLDTKIDLGRIDHSFTPNLTMSSMYFRHSRPRVNGCAEGGCNTPGGTHSYVGSGNLQTIRSQLEHTQLNWVAKPNLFNHTTVSWDRWIMEGRPLPGQSEGFTTALGFKGLVDNTGGAPLVNLAGGVNAYSSIGYGNRAFGGEACNRTQILDDLTWIKGKHTLKAGFEFRHHMYPWYGWLDATSGNWNFNALETGGYNAAGANLGTTGDPFASFLLGQVDSASLVINGSPEMFDDYFAPWGNDEIKVTKNLTITVGLRYDQQTSLSEKKNRLSSFSPTTPNPGAGNILGAMVYASPSHRSFETPSHDAWGPRGSFAYHLRTNTVVRGGYGIYYAGNTLGYDQNSVPDQGWRLTPSIANVTTGLYPTFWLDDGFPQSVIPTTQPDTSASLENGGNPIYIQPHRTEMARNQNWTFTVEHQFSNNVSLDVSYVGSHATRLFTSNSSAAGIGDNISNPSVLSLGSAVLGSDITSPEAQASAAVMAMPVDSVTGYHMPYSGFVGNVAQAVRPFPQYQTINYRNINNQMSKYEALDVKLEKRFANGLQGRVAYTFSKLIDSSEAGTHWGNPGVMNPLDTQKDLTSVSQDDVPHSLILGFTYQLPFGPGRKYATSGVVSKLAEGWTWAGMQRYDSGRPQNITMNNDMGSVIFNATKRPDKIGGGKIFTGGHFDPNTMRFLSTSGWADPGPLMFGNAGREDPHVRGFHYFNEDWQVSKNTSVYKERAKLKFEADFGNIFNRHAWCDPSTNWSSASSFGEVYGQCDLPRMITLSMRLGW